MKATNLSNKKSAQVADGPVKSKTINTIAKRTGCTSGDRVLLEWKSGYTSTVTLVQDGRGVWKIL